MIIDFLRLGKDQQLGDSCILRNPSNRDCLNSVVINIRDFLHIYYEANVSLAAMYKVEHLITRTSLL